MSTKLYGIFIFLVIVQHSHAAELSLAEWLARDMRASAAFCLGISHEQVEALQNINEADIKNISKLPDGQAITYHADLHDGSGYIFARCSKNDHNYDIRHSYVVRHIRSQVKPGRIPKFIHLPLPVSLCDKFELWRERKEVLPVQDDVPSS